MSEQMPLNLSDRGAELRDEAMQRAADHADGVKPSWSERAFQYLMHYPYARFRAEEVRLWAQQNGLPRPPDPRSWGSVFMRARKQGLLINDGYESVSNPKAHKRPAVVWKFTTTAERR